ncbi:D-aminoacyl-tRNA deacylase [Haladaptatus litoreus]|uniref:D-aminoacyl-tRNA deacylase n=1 Tax=Haladaptatus litoreus TaxID=553468 RepID=A0A1N6WK19_9EURY|nr:D-aminoacyl-tRNA deacylase [Haladaptatus litoreus]SIQ90402.1 D-aminoacyl-tRNA deacylase [Haladaptatus litoreus]
MIAVVVSRADYASEHIGEYLRSEAEWTENEDDSRPDADGGGAYYQREGFELREFESLHLDIENVAEAFSDPEMLVFASRHSGDTGPLLTAHFTGNFGPAEYGGTDGNLAETSPNAQKKLLDSFDKHAPESYEVGMECTHHGPSEVGVPSMFVELGSGDEQWSDSDAARAVAQAILDLRGVEPTRERQLVGFGGGHYVPRFERIVRETDWAVGHIASDWNLEELGSPEKSQARETIRQAFERSGAEYAVCEGAYPELESVVADLGYRIVSETWVREVSGVSLSLGEELETELSSVESGLRFGEMAGDVDSADDTNSAGDTDDADDPNEFEVVSLPSDLLDSTTGIDREETRDAVAKHAIAFETEQGGTRVSGRAAVHGPGDYDAIIDALAALLDRKYDEVERTPDEIVAREVGFDPEKARKLGVSEGPKFGKLSAGTAVTVAERTIPPEAVRTERTHRFSI